MDDLMVAISAVRANPDWESNRVGWGALEKALAQITGQIDEESLEKVISEHRDLPKVLTEVANFFTSKWWCVAAQREPDEGASIVLIAYLRLVRRFYHREPETNLEKSGNMWVMDILELLNDQTANSDEHNQALALAMVIVDFVPEQWREDVAKPAFTSALRNAEAASSGLVWTLPAQDLRKLLTWACCLATAKSCRPTVQDFVESLELAEGVLSHDCMILYRRLQNAIATSVE